MVSSDKPLAQTVLDIVGGKSKLVHKPLPQDDPTRRRPDITRAAEALGWQPRTALREGLERTITDFAERVSS